MTQRTGKDLINEARARIREVSVNDVQAMQQRGEPAVIVDVREPNEWNLGRLPQAILIPRGTLETTVEQRVPRDQTVVLYCASGNRSTLAADTLQQLGYTNVASMAGGIRAWIDAGGAVES